MPLSPLLQQLLQQQTSSLPTGQRKVVGPLPQVPAPVMAPPPVPGVLGNLSRNVQSQRMGGVLPSTNLPQSMMGQAQPQPTLPPPEGMNSMAMKQPLPGSNQSPEAGELMKLLMQRSAAGM